MTCGFTCSFSADGTHIVDLFLTSDPSTSINDRLVAEGILRKLTDEEQGVVTSDDEPGTVYTFLSDITTTNILELFEIMGDNFCGMPQK